MPKKKFEKENDNIISKIKNIYRKKCDLNNVIPNKAFKDKLDNAEETAEMKQLQLPEQVGPVGLRSIIDSFIDAQYHSLKVLRLWRVGAEDEGVRIISNYLKTSPSVQQLDLLENSITSLGCQFLCKSLLESKSPLLKLKLDGNPIGTAGLKILSDGLKQNHTLQKLCLRNCNIDSNGGKILQAILANINSGLLTLKLCQNPLKAQGLFQILRALETNDILKKFKACNIGVQFIKSVMDPQEQKVFIKIKQVLKNNKTVSYYDIRFNPMTDFISQELINIIQANLSIQEFKLSQTMDISLKTKLRDILDSRKIKGSKPKKKKQL